MFMFIKMSNWFGQEISDVASYEKNIQDHIDNGNTVILCDDISSFAEEMGIEEEVIEIIE